MRSPKEVRQDVRQRAYEDAAERLALEVRHYLNTGVGKFHLETALKDFTQRHYEKVAEEFKP